MCNPAKPEPKKNWLQDYLKIAWILSLKILSNPEVILRLNTAFEPPNTPKHAEKTKRYSKKIDQPFWLNQFFYKPLISLRVSAFIGG